GAVRWGAQLCDARRKRDDAAAVAYPPGGLAQDVEATFLVDIDHPAEVGIGHVAERRETHDPSIAYHHIDAAECPLSLIEQTLHGTRITNVRLYPDRAPSGRLDLFDDSRCEFAVLLTVDGHGIAVLGQALGRGSADAS